MVSATVTLSPIFAVPLGEARLLWEIGPGGCEVRLLRSRLGIDSGYLSRLLRSVAKGDAISQDTSTVENPAVISQFADAV